MVGYISCLEQRTGHASGGLGIVWIVLVSYVRWNGLFVVFIACYRDKGGFPCAASRFFSVSLFVPKDLAKDH